MSPRLWTLILAKLSSVIYVLARVIHRTDAENAEKISCEKTLPFSSDLLLIAHSACVKLGLSLEFSANPASSRLILNFPAKARER